VSFEKVSKTLVGDTPGRSTELNYFRIGPQDAARKVYLQAALHADEQPGIMVLHHLLPLLRAADRAGELNARFVVFPMVNPLGMGDIEFGQHQGRYNRGSGVNHNRDWPVLYDAVGEGMAAKFGDDGDENIRSVRAALRSWAESLPQVTAFDQWRQSVVTEACDADYVFDLHCDDDSLLHIFSIPQLADNMQQLANWSGAAATMLAQDSGGGSFDEVWPAIWLRLAKECADKPLPLPVVSCTLEKGRSACGHRPARDRVFACATCRLTGLLCQSWRLGRKRRYHSRVDRTRWRRRICRQAAIAGRYFGTGNIAQNH